VVLNEFLWRDVKGDTPMPAPQYNVFPPSKDASRPSRDPD